MDFKITGIQYDKSNIVFLNRQEFLLLVLTDMISERKCFMRVHTLLNTSFIHKVDQNIFIEYLITLISLSCRWLALTAMYIIYKEDL